MDGSMLKTVAQRAGRAARSGELTEGEMTVLALVQQRVTRDARRAS